MLVLARAGLSSYLCTLCTMCDTLSRLGGGIYLTTVHKVDVAAGQAPMVQPFDHDNGKSPMFSSW
jgi:hypothetical protein